MGHRRKSVAGAQQVGDRSGAPQLRVHVACPVYVLMEAGHDQLTVAKVLQHAQALLQLGSRACGGPPTGDLQGKQQGQAGLSAEGATAWAWGCGLGRGRRELAGQREWGLTNWVERGSGAPAAGSGCCGAGEGGPRLKNLQARGACISYAQAGLQP